MPKRVWYLLKYKLRMGKAAVAIHARARDFAMTTKTIFWSLDPLTIRVWLAASSFAWAALALPWWFVETKVFDRHGYEMLAAIAPDWVWCVLFLLHGFGVSWCSYTKKIKLRDKLQTPTNVFGFILWSFATFSINYSLRSITPGTALEWIAVLLAFWAMVISGKKPEAVLL